MDVLLLIAHRGHWSDLCFSLQFVFNRWVSNPVKINSQWEGNRLFPLTEIIESWPKVTHRLEGLSQPWKLVRNKRKSCSQTLEKTGKGCCHPAVVPKMFSFQDVAGSLARDDLGPVAVWPESTSSGVGSDDSLQSTLSSAECRLRPQGLLLLMMLEDRRFQVWLQVPEPQIRGEASYSASEVPGPPPTLIFFLFAMITVLWT